MSLTREQLQGQLDTAISRNLQQQDIIDMLTRKHFEAIAEAIADIQYNHNDSHDMYVRGLTEMRHAIAHNLADYCEGNNSRFDRRKFIKACGVEPLPKPNYNKESEA